MSWFELYTAILNTLAVAAGVLVTSLPVAFFLALFTSRTDMYGARWAWLAVCSQLVVPLYATVGAWSAGFGSQGWWPLAQAFVVRHQWHALASVTMIHAVAAIPSVMLILSLGFHWTRRSQEEMALIDGGTSNVVYRVWIPQMRGWLAAAGLWAIVPVMTEMVVTNLYQVPTLAEQIYLDVSLGTANATTYCVSVGLCSLPLLGLAVSLRRHLPALSSCAIQMAQHPPIPMKLGRARWALSVFAWSIVLLIVVVPLTNLWLRVGWESFLATDGSLQHRWTWNRLSLTILGTITQLSSEFQWTAALACTSSTTAFLLAAILRYSCRRQLLIRIINVGCLALIAMPGPLVALLTTKIFLTVPIAGLSWLYDHSLAAPVLAQQTRLLPLSWLLVGGILSTISSQAWELASLDKLSLWNCWRIVVWRPTWRLWLAAWLLLASVSAGELSTHLLLLPPGVTTVAQRLFEFLHFGMRYQDSGLCLALVAMGWIVAAVIWQSLRSNIVIV